MLESLNDYLSLISLLLISFFAIRIVIGSLVHGFDEHYHLIINNLFDYVDNEDE